MQPASRPLLLGTLASVIAVGLAGPSAAHGQEPTHPARSAAPGRTEHGTAALPAGLSAGDWTAIRAAHRTAGNTRHAVTRVGTGCEASNPGQRWRTQFDGRGSTTTSDAGDWSWGLELERYGFPGSEVEVHGSARVDVDGGRIVYAWSPVLEEWYVNERRGLEHGFTVKRRPPPGTEADAPLTLTLGVRGSLRPAVTANGRDVRFADGAGAIALTYAGLRVFDAEGRELEASFEAASGQLTLRVDERGARYPLLIDPIAQRAYLKASNPDPSDDFAWTLAASGNTVVVGAPGERSNATGVNGDQSDNSLPGAGAAYVFVQAGESWTQEAYLKASNTEQDNFGWSVAVSGDTVVIGAKEESSGASGVNGDQTDNSAPSSGAVYVFVRGASGWEQQAYLKASNPDPYDRFGHSVAVSGDTVVVGATYESSGATGVDGNQSDNSAMHAGAAYVFVRSGTSWSQQAYLKASNAEADDGFGVSTAVSADTILVGTISEDSSATGIDGDQFDNSAQDSGAAYVFVRNGTSWSQQAYLKASNAELTDRFGFSLAIQGDTAVVATPYEGSGATGVNGDQADNSKSDSGAAYVFVRNGASWSQQAYLKASNTDGGDSFGFAVSISADTVVIGARGEDSSSTGVGGSQGNDNEFASAGAAYVFEREGTDWSQRAYLKASNTDMVDRFGHSVAVTGDTVVVGAYGEDSGAAGVDGDQEDNGSPEAGAAYVFDLAIPALPYCTGKVNSLGCVPFMSYNGVPSATSTSPFQIVGNDVIAGELGLLLYSLSAGQQGFHGATLCVKSPIHRSFPAKIAKGTGPPPCTGILRRNFNLPIQAGNDPQLTVGQTVFAQWLQRDPTDPAGFADSLTDGLEFEIGP